MQDSNLRLLPCEGSGTAQAGKVYGWCRTGRQAVRIGSGLRASKMLERIFYSAGPVVKPAFPAGATFGESYSEYPVEYFVPESAVLEMQEGQAQSVACDVRGFGPGVRCWSFSSHARADSTSISASPPNIAIVRT